MQGWLRWDMSMTKDQCYLMGLRHPMIAARRCRKICTSAHRIPIPSFLPSDRQVQRPLQGSPNTKGLDTVVLAHMGQGVLVVVTHRVARSTLVPPLLATLHRQDTLQHLLGWELQVLGLCLRQGFHPLVRPSLL